MNRLAKFLSAYATERARKRKQERAYADLARRTRERRESFEVEQYRRHRAAALKGARG